MQTPLQVQMHMHLQADMYLQTHILVQTNLQVQVYRRCKHSCIYDWHARRSYNLHKLSNTSLPKINTRPSRAGLPALQTRALPASTSPPDQPQEAPP